jgi:hypothetical protein
MKLFFKKEIIYTEKTMALCNFVLYRYHMDYHMIEPGPARWKSGI